MVQVAVSPCFHSIYLKRTHDLSGYLIFFVKSITTKGTIAVAYQGDIGRAGPLVFTFGDHECCCKEPLESECG